MQDIDFEELDRAVSSVLGGTTQPAKDATSVPVISTPPRESIATAVTTRPSSGRFMDVVHPSSDMRSQTPAQVAPPRSIEMPVPSRPPTPQTPTVTPIQEPAEASILAEEVVMPTLPQDDPLESPFLSDAKVEKRPLGAFSFGETAQVNEVERAPVTDSKPFLDLSAALNEEYSHHAPADEPKSDETIPEEESSVDEPVDLEVSEEQLAGISETGDTTGETSPSPAQPFSHPEPIQEQTSSQPVQEVTVSAITAPLAAASIPQQYVERPLSEDQPSGAIYDTESYHQPLTHPQKKNTGWLVIVWIIGLILLGGAIGAALYFFVLPQL